MDRAAARRICRREGVGKVKALEVGILWLQHVIKARTLVLKTGKSFDNCADLETKTWSGWYIELTWEHAWFWSASVRQTRYYGWWELRRSRSGELVNSGQQRSVLKAALDEILRYDQ